METKSSSGERVMVKLLKEPFSLHTITSIAKDIKLTRQGTWKAINKLEKDRIITIENVNNTKTSTAIIKLNWSNPITEKTLSLLLTKESVKYQRWRINFAEMERNVNFIILFGSILNNPKDANDIDLLAIAGKKNFKAVEETIARIQQTQLKKIHLVDLTAEELSHELKRPNKAYIEAFKKGVVLYGQNNFIQFVRGLI